MDLIKKGANYGWNIREGSHCFDPETGYDLIAGACPKIGAAGEPLVGPIVEYPNCQGSGRLWRHGGGRSGLSRARPCRSSPDATSSWTLAGGSPSPGDGILFVGTRLDADGASWTL